MRTITGHHVNDCNRAITIEAEEPDRKTGAVINYDVTWMDRDHGGAYFAVSFQHEPIAEVGTNGVTNEVFLAILIDRLECFQQGPFACPENVEALDHLKAARAALLRRTDARIARGVEGTHTI